MTSSSTDGREGQSAGAALRAPSLPRGAPVLRPRISHGSASAVTSAHRGFGRPVEPAFSLIDRSAEPNSSDRQTREVHIRLRHALFQPSAPNHLTVKVDRANGRFCSIGEMRDDDGKVIFTRTYSEIDCTAAVVSMAIGVSIQFTRPPEDPEPSRPASARSAEGSPWGRPFPRSRPPALPADRVPRPRRARARRDEGAILLDAPRAAPRLAETRRKQIARDLACTLARLPVLSIHSSHGPHV